MGQSNTEKHKERIIKKLEPFLLFLEIEVAGGFTLLIFTLLALALANSPWSDWYNGLFDVKLGFNIDNFKIENSFLFWINNGLMTIFFFVVGIEIKREIKSGQLKEFKIALLPIFAALGGMLVPALIYLIVLGGEPGVEGFGIPVATDIAFVIGFLSLFGERVPLNLRIFLLTLAIIDDIGAVLVIAFFYGKNISISALFFCLAGFSIILAFHRLAVRQVNIYVVLGVGIWLAFYYSGVHPTIAGVLLGLLTPAEAFIGDKTLREAVVEYLAAGLDAKKPKKEVARYHGLLKMSKEIFSPIEHLEYKLHPWVSFLILPLFAFANAGIVFKETAILSPISLAVILGLVVGKPLGITLFSLMAVKIFRVTLPTGMSWPILIGAGCLAGIGFTMSIFIADLAFTGTNLQSGKMGTLFASTASLILGLSILSLVLPKNSSKNVV